MNYNIMTKNGEIGYLVDKKNIVAFSSLEEWQIDGLICPTVDDSSRIYSDKCLQTIDKICTDWLNSLTREQWELIKKRGSLFGTPLPNDWIKVWRFILKEPDLRDSEKATKNGTLIGTFRHLWNFWAEQCIEKYLSPLEKELLYLVDIGIPYAEIGEHLLAKYGDEFWKPRKKNTKTTPAQVVNNYLHTKMPTKIARGELTDMAIHRIIRLGD